MRAPHEAWIIPDPLAVDTCPCCGWPVESQRSRPYGMGDEQGSLRVCGNCFGLAMREGADRDNVRILAALRRRVAEREARHA